MNRSKDMPSVVEEISLPEAAAELHLPWWHAYSLATSGKLGPLRREGRRWILRRSEVRAYAAARDDNRVPA
jgi:hypothetical protein